MPSSACKKCARSEEHTSELQSHDNLVCRLLLEKNTQKHPLVTPVDTYLRPVAPGRAPAATGCAQVVARVGSVPAVLPDDLRFFFLKGRAPPENPLFPPPPPFPL